jgi:pimeloyl-ACP methyl ester carboxylesterase
MNEFKLTEWDAASRHGRVHYRSWEGVDAKAATPILILLHPLPHDGSFFNAIAPYMARGRTVIAPDYPGYGGSDALEESPVISLYAEAMIDALDEAGLKGPYDFFGFHTGCLVAVEISLLYPAGTRRLVQVDVPYFDQTMRQDLMASDMAVGGFIAAFSYVGEERYPAVQHDNLVIATASSLLEPSRAAAMAIPGCRLKELPEVEAPALENGAESISGIALNFLDQ